MDARPQRNGSLPVQAFGDPVADHLKQQIMVPEGLGKPDFHTGISGGRCFNEPWDVDPHMAPRSKEVGKNDNLVGPLRDTPAQCRSDGWFGKLHVGRFDDLPGRLPPQTFRNPHQEFITLGNSRPVVDQQDGHAL